MYRVRDLRLYLNQPVLVEWEDACGTDDWNTEDDASTVTVYTLGYLYFVSRNELKIARHRGEDADYSGKHAIPAGMVRSVWILAQGAEISGA